MVQWLHTNCLAPSEFRLLVGTFRAVFPRMAIWSSGVGDVFLIGSIEPAPWVYDRLIRRIDATPGVRQDLESIGIWHPAALFAAFVVDEDRVARLVGPRPRLHTDDVFGSLRGAPFPRIEGFDPDRDVDAVATYLLGFAELGRRRDAEAAFARAVAVDPADVQARIALGELLLDDGQAARALEVAQAALRREPENARVKDLMARAQAAATH